MSSLKLNPVDTVDFRKIGDPRNGKLKPIGKRLDMLADSTKEVLCETCLTGTDMYCSNCFLTPYCTKKCWSKGQKTHAEKCGNQLGYTLKTKNSKGNEIAPHYVFAKTQSRGQILIMEQPLVILPTLPEGYGEDKERSLDGLKLICFGCNKHFYPRPEPTYCSCGITLCDKNCCNIYHRPQECKILMKFSGKNFTPYFTSMRKYIELYLDLCVLRLLNYFAPSATIPFHAFQWKNFLLLTLTPRYKHYDKNRQDPFDGIRYMEFMKKSVDCLKFSLMYVSFNRQVVLQVYKLLIAFWEEFEGNNGVWQRLLFMSVHFMHQSYCSPNMAASISYEHDKDGNSSMTMPIWIYYVLKEIREKDNNPSLMYDFSPKRFMPLPLRMIYLSEIGLPCASQTCTRCQDPSDGGTQSGSIRCVQCYHGIYIEDQVKGKDLLLDTFPKRWSPEYIKCVDWKCDACRDVQPFSLILEVNIKCYKEWQLTTRNSVKCFISAASKFIDFYENSYLHTMNGTILQAKFRFLLATREKHFLECGFSANGHPLRENSDLRLLPTKWNLNELRLVNRRADYAQHCCMFLEYANHANIALHYCDYVFLMLERSFMKLLSSCRLFFMDLSKYSADKFVKDSHVAVDSVKKWRTMQILQFRELFRANPFLTLPEKDTKLFAKMHGKDSRPLMTALLIFKMMGITLGDFMMGHGAHAEQRKMEGFDKWPSAVQLHLPPHREKGKEDNVCVENGQR